MKRNISLILIFVAMMILNYQNVSVYAGENILSMNTLFECDFDSGLQPGAGEIENGASMIVSEGDRTFLRADSRLQTVKFFVIPKNG